MGRESDELLYDYPKKLENTSAKLSSFYSYSSKIKKAFSLITTWNHAVFQPVKTREQEGRWQHKRILYGLIDILLLTCTRN